jgi:hypothetical protein
MTPASRPLNAHMVSSAVTASTEMAGAPVGLSAGKFASLPVAKPNTMINANGTSFSSVIAICTSADSRVPRTATSVSVQMIASAHSACSTALSFNAGTNTMR